MNTYHESDFNDIKNYIISSPHSKYKKVTGLLENEKISYYYKRTLINYITPEGGRRVLLAALCTVTREARGGPKQP